MKLNRFLTFLAIGGVMLANSAMGLAYLPQNDFENIDINESEAVELDYVEEQESTEPDNIELQESTGTDNIELQESTGIDNIELQESTGTDNIELQESTEPDDELIQRLRKELSITRTDYRQLITNLSDTRRRLEIAREEKMTLEEQLANIDGQVQEMKEKLVSVMKQIIHKENRIALLFEEIEIREIALAYQKNLVRDYVRILYQEENDLFFFDEDGSVSTVKLLLSDNSVSENLRDLDYLDLLRETGIHLIDKLEEIHYELEEKRTEMTESRVELENLKDRLALEKEQLEIQKKSKEDLLRLTRGQESIYQELLEQTEKEQEEMIVDIRALTDAVAFIERKMAEEGENFDPQHYTSILDGRNRALLDFRFDPALSGNSDFIWPVEPTRGISAYFRDSSYYSFFGVPHNAIDLPVYQGSPVRAVADSVVYTTRDNGYGYSYIILAHANGFMTVYGHMSAILVEEGQMLKQGAIIGLSGGMPGTLGAGYMTTGPHLHFEVLLNGKYVDPLLYLPLDTLTESQMSRLPEKYMEAWERAVLGAILR